MKTKHKFNYLLITIFLFFISCAQSNATSTYCDESLPCSGGYECLKNKCEKILNPCSSEHKDGICENKSEECIDGVCQALVHPKCKNVTCSDKGVCIVNNDVPTCICEEGNHPEGLNCVLDGFIACGDKECTNAQHCQNDLCVDNTKTVLCDSNVNLPQNALLLEMEVEIKWINGFWEDTPKCEWTCRQGYKEFEDTCVFEPFNCSEEHPEALCENNNEICIDGTCVLPEMGSICQNQNQCPDDMLCLLNSSSLTNGYCTKRCSDNSVCGEYQCGDLINGQYCLKPCSNDTYCRDDFVCNDDSLCRPKCMTNENCKDYEACELSSGLCKIENANCDLYSQNCSDSTRACYPFEEISQTACATEGILADGKLCNNDSICKAGSICTNIDNNATTQKRCTTPCKMSNNTNEGNSDCELYNTCIQKEGWSNLGYCKYDSDLVPIGISCDTSTDCGHEDALCGRFDGTVDVKICTNSCMQDGAMDLSRETFINDVICVKFTTGGLLWMDICDSDADCYDSNFFCYNNSSYMRSYCMPKPL